MPIRFVILLSIVVSFFNAPNTYSQSSETQTKILSGTIIDKKNGEPLEGATVFISSLERGAVSDRNGLFRLERIPQGRYELEIRFLGYKTEKIIHIHPAEQSLLIELEFSSAFAGDVVVTSSPLGRSVQYQPAQVIGREQLQDQAAPSFGEILDGSPGVTMRSFGSAPARPVIRGLDGDRVLVLQNGERMGDLSSTAADHAIALDPMVAERVEVVRGPASLLYGSSAMGGVVNLFSFDLPREWTPGTTGDLMLQGASVNRMGAGMGQGRIAKESWAVNARASYRQGDDVRTPEGILPGTFLENYSFGSGFGYRNSALETGVALTGIRYDYGLPDALYNSDEEVIIQMERFQVQHYTKFDLNRFFEAAELRVQASRYNHKEIERERTSSRKWEEETGLEFDQQSLSTSLTFRHKPGGISHGGALSFSGYARSLEVGGDEILTPDVRSFFIAGTLFEEIGLAHALNLELGGRLEWQRMLPQRNASFSDLASIADRSEIATSAAIGLNYQPLQNWEIGFQLARAYRVPTLEELYSDAAHLGAGAYEIGDPELKNEVSLGFDAFTRFEIGFLSAELAGYINRINNYVKYTPTGEVHESSGLPIFMYEPADVLYWGFESSLDMHFSEYWKGSVTADYVRGSERDGNRTPLPLVPPLRTGLSLQYQPSGWWVEGRIRRVQKQDRTAPQEESTGSYLLIGLDAGYRLSKNGNHRIVLRVDNLLNEKYRDHLSRIEDRNNPMPGRNVTVAWRWDF